MKYIPAEKLLSGIKKILDENKYDTTYDCAFRDGNNSAVQRIKNLAVSLQREPKSSSNLVDIDTVREDFIAEVYRVLDADSTNDRANAIIDAFDSLPTVSQVQPEVDLEKSRNLIRATLNGVTRLGSLCDDQTIEHAVDNLIDELGLNARKEE